MKHVTQTQLHSYAGLRARSPRKRFRQILLAGQYVADDPGGELVVDPSGAKVMDRSGAKNPDGSIRMVPRMIVKDKVYYAQDILERRGERTDGPTIVESDVDLVAAFPDKFGRLHTTQCDDTNAELREMAQRAAEKATEEVCPLLNPDTLSNMPAGGLARLATEEGIDVLPAKDDRAQVLKIIRAAAEAVKDRPPQERLPNPSTRYNACRAELLSLLEKLPDYQKIDDDEQRIESAVCNATTNMTPKSWANREPLKRLPYLIHAIRFLTPATAATMTPTEDLLHGCEEAYRIISADVFMSTKGWSHQVVLIISNLWNKASRLGGMNNQPPAMPTKGRQIDAKRAISELAQWVKATFPLADNAIAPNGNVGAGN